MDPTDDATRAGCARPLRADAERNRRLILDVAVRVFAERGLSATLNDIAHEAGVGVGTVYRRFPDKDALIDALFEVKFTKLLDLARAAGAAPTAGEALRDSIVAPAQARASDRGLTEVLVRAPAHGASAERKRELLHAVIEDLVTRAQREGSVRPDLDATDVPMFIRMVGAVADGARDVSPDLWQRYTQLLLDGIRPVPGQEPLRQPPLRPGEIAAAMQRDSA